MITFNLTKCTATAAMDLIEVLEMQLPLIANDHGVISMFCKIDDEIYSAVSILMSLIKDGGNESIRSVCNALLSWNWSVVSI